MKNKLNVCIVDDDEIYQYTMSLNLKSLDSVGEIKVFNDGLEATNFMLDKLHNQEELPDIIFLDINMPVMDGFQFMEEYEKIKSKLTKNIIIYMISSSVDPVDIEKATQIEDISDYLTKPIRQQQLMDILEKLD
ncbi:response regulator receiver domain-containing protein [Maribacter vaceletii]|uniref:Response regulator receiver domain-containing protein n=1 Tax=Maribacter vaceletii TaxID=1206816 RepID=A0A495EAX9_9FLAO|nr:response regulator [Maribacter vaceletii]RKR14045.1 response regulator receiver domain-containing protein [Maribacter vaceletii]